MRKQRVILGTAQWGLAYGVTNQTGRITDQALRRLASCAESLEIKTLDSSPNYGDAEERIGELGSCFRVQTKVLAKGKSHSDIVRSLQEGLERTNKSAFETVLIHDWAILSVNEKRRAARIVEDIRQLGISTSVGVSVYSDVEARAALAGFDQLDVIQVPLSVLDQRLGGSQILNELSSRGVKVQARSVFLQGMTLEPSTSREFRNHPDLKRLTAWSVNGSLLELSIGYIRSLELIDEIVVGVTSDTELREIHAALSRASPEVDWRQFASADFHLLDPRSWSFR